MPRARVAKAPHVLQDLRGTGWGRVRKPHNGKREDFRSALVGGFWPREAAGGLAGCRIAYRRGVRGHVWLSLVGMNTGAGIRSSKVAI